MISAAPVFHRVTYRRAAPALWAVAFAAFALAEAWLAVRERTSIAAAVAIVPIAAVTFGRSRIVLAGLLIPVLAATLILGHDFAQTSVGPLYILDVALLVTAILAAPAVLRAIGTNRGITAILALFIFLTAMRAYDTGFSRIVLRQAVLGFYAAWAVIGIALAQSGLAGRFARVAYYSSLGAGTVFVMLHLHVGSSLISPLASSVISVAQSLYVGYGVLFVLFLPAMLRRSGRRNVLLAAQLAVIILAFSRSVWVALPLALCTTLAVCGLGRRVGRQLLRLCAVLVVLIAIGVVARPSMLHKVGQQANSILNYSGGTTRADNNARWRLSNWRYGISTISRHPVAGIGFGQAEVPVSVCTTGCNNLNAAQDSTVVAGSDLHNSILAIPLRLGLPVFALFVAFEIAVIARARRYGRENPLLQWLFACHLLTGFTALTAVVLEGPYMGIFFWLFGGLVLGLPTAKVSLPLPGIQPSTPA